MASGMSWAISGSYYEACNCVAVCPCRRHNDVPAGPPTFGICQFLLSWRIVDGWAPGMKLAGLGVVMAGFSTNALGLWSVKLFIDGRADAQQHGKLVDIFLGREGGNVAVSRHIATVFEIKSSTIVLDHRKGLERILIEGHGGSQVLRQANFVGVATSSITGHDHPGTEYISDFNMSDSPLEWNHVERSGFAADFAYYG